MVDAFNAFNGGKSTIKRIKVVGKNENNNEVLLNTDIIAKTEFVDIELHVETGEVNSESIFEQILAVAKKI